MVLWSALSVQIVMFRLLFGIFTIVKDVGTWGECDHAEADHEREERVILDFLADLPKGCQITRIENEKDF